MTARLPEPPSAGVLLDALLAEREARLGSVDAMTNKAGILLGFTGALVGLTALLDHWLSRLVVFVPAGFAVVYSLLALKTVLVPGLKPDALRQHLLMQPPLGAQLRILDHLTLRHDDLVKVVKDKAKSLNLASIWLAVTIGALAITSVLEGVVMSETDPEPIPDPPPIEDDPSLGEQFERSQEPENAALRRTYKDE